MVVVHVPPFPRYQVLTRNIDMLYGSSPQTYALALAIHTCPDALALPDAVSFTDTSPMTHSQVGQPCVMPFSSLVGFFLLLLLNILCLCLLPNYLSLAS